MKKFLLMLVLAVTVMAASAQIGQTKTLTIDTLDAATTVTSSVATITGEYNAITFQALCTEIGGTSDGSLHLEGSVDGVSYLPLSGNIGYSYPSDTLTITSGAVWQFVVTDAAFKYYKVVATGTASDTTLVTIKYVLK